MVPLPANGYLFTSTSVADRTSCYPVFILVLMYFSFIACTGYQSPVAARLWYRRHRVRLAGAVVDALLSRGSRAVPLASGAALLQGRVCRSGDLVPFILGH